MAAREGTRIGGALGFVHHEAAGGIVMVAAAALALLMENSPLSAVYDALLDTPVSIRVGALGIDKPLLLWINDGLMAVFFFLVGLEIKRELVHGELRDRRNVVLPLAFGPTSACTEPSDWSTDLRLRK